MIFKPLVIQYSNYFTEFKKSIKHYYGLTSLRNLMFIKPDKRLYYQDNLETEFCISHPDWSQVQDPPSEFPPEEHTHNYADPAHTHNYAASNHTHPRIVGEITIWPTDTAPTGWLLCSGEEIPLGQAYAALDSLLGGIYGLGPSGRSKTPDLRGRVPLGQDDMGGYSANRVTAAAADSLGGSGGSETHTLTTSETPSHYHAIGGDLLSANWVSGTQRRNLRTVGGASDMQSGSIGGGSPHNNLQPYLTLNFIIFAGA